LALAIRAGAFSCDLLQTRGPKMAALMVDWFRCIDCKIIFVLLESTENKCPSCGGTHGEVVSQEHVKEGVKAGTYFGRLRIGKQSQKKSR
jgi:hypothetical protein